MLRKLFRAPIAVALIFACFVYIYFGLMVGMDAWKLGITKGRQTEHWRKADQTRIVALGGTRWPGRHYLPRCQEFSLTYQYWVGESSYLSGNYHALGSLVADERAIRRALGEIHTLDAWYDPENPSDAVLKKGIAFDCSTDLTIMRIVRGGVIALVALVYVWKKDAILSRLSRRKQDGANEASEECEIE